MRHILAAIFILFIVLGLCSCNTEKQAAKKVSWLLAHDKMAEECARLYPPKIDSVKPDTSKVAPTQPDVTNTVDSLNNIIDSIVGLGTVSDNCDSCITGYAARYDEQVVSLKKAIAKLKSNYKPCDSIKIIKQPYYVRHTAEEERLKSIIAQKDKQIKQKDDLIIKQQKNLDNDNWWKIAALVTWFAVSLGFVFRFFIIKKPL